MALITILFQAHNKSNNGHAYRFVNLYMVGNTDGNISNEVSVGKMTMHVGFVNLSMTVLILMSLILKTYHANRIYKFVEGMCIISIGFVNLCMICASISGNFQKGIFHFLSHNVRYN